MPSMVQTVAIPLAVATVAVAGTAVYFTSRTSPASPQPAPVAAPAPPAALAPAPAPQPAPQPAPVAATTAPEPPPPPAFVPGNTPAQPVASAPAQTADTAQAAMPFAMPPTTTFNPVTQPYSLMRDSAAYVAATTDAPQMYPLKSGTAVEAVARSADDKWIIALTENGQAAYLPTADLGPYDPRLTPAPDLPGSVSGVTQVVDTATLTVNGQTVQLAGIKGESGIYAAQLQALINAQGGQVTCTLQGAAYVCTLANGVDIARAGLYNGGAQLGDDASADYRAQAASAQAARRGIWR